MSSEPNASATSGLDANLAGLLCYLFGWVSGLIFLLIDKRPFVRFHAAQSIGISVAVFVVMIAFWIVTFILAIITGGLGGFLVLLTPLIILGVLALVVICMIKAYKGEKFKLPVIGNIAEKMAGN
jgi:uncharacterized membrane protein